MIKPDLQRSASKIEKVDISAADHTFSEPTWKGLFLAAPVNFYAIIVAKLFESDAFETIHLIPGHNPFQVVEIKMAGSSITDTDHPNNQLWGLLR